MKKKRLISTVLALLISAFIVAFSVVTVVAYSSDEDPLITLSYLNEVVIPQLKQELGMSASVNTSTQDTVQSENSTPPQTPPEENVPSNTKPTVTGTDNSSNAQPQNLGTYQTIELNAGDVLLAKSALEIIVRPGSIVCAVSPFETQGVADITNGNELYDGDEFAINAYSVIPRGNDGRGLRVITQKAYILIRGEYEIG